MKLQKQNFLIILINISFFSILFFVGCDSIYENQKISIKKNITSEKADRVGDTVVITSLKGNKINWYLTSIHVEEFSKKRLIIADDVLVYYFKNDDIVSTLTSDKAEIDEIKKLLKAIGNVVVLSDNGVLKTELLYWNLSNNQVFTQENVTIIKGENVMYGKNLLTNIELQSAELDDIGAVGEIYEEDIDI